VSREGAMIAARDRARRLQAALGEGVPVLLGCPLVVLHASPRRAVAASTAAAANEERPAPVGDAGSASRPAGTVTLTAPDEQASPPLR
jgi:hypothetical protein